MDYHGFKAALNSYFARHVGGDRRPVFHNIETTCPELAHLERSFPWIRAEFDALMKRGSELPRYHDIDAGEAKISATTKHNWNVFLLELLGHKLEANRSLCPATCEALGRVPNVMQAFFSILDPGKSIPAHDGPYLGYLRYHLGVSIPKIRPPRILVAGQPYTWREGEGVLFDDSWTHEVQNESPEPRAVLVIDILRPMPLAPRLLNRFVTGVIARNTYGRKVARNAQLFVPDPRKQTARPQRRAA